jgi:uncharacterized protein (DUF983 family)
MDTRLLKNGFLLRCPKCSQGRVLDGYLTKADKCSECGESYEGLNADDGPAWFVMIFVGVLLVPVLIVLGVTDALPLWGVVLTITAFATGFTLALLPPIKGIFIAILWYMRQQK